MASVRFHRLPADRQARILDAAAQELGEHGFEGASFNRILAAAGLSKSAAYYYFDDKADLCATVIERYWEELHAKVPFEPDDLTAATFWPRIAELYTLQFAWADARPWMWGVLKAARELLRGLAGNAPLAKRFRPMTKWLQALLAKGQAVGALRDDLPDGLLVALIIGIDAASDAWFMENGPTLSAARATQLAAKVQEILQTAVQPRPRKAAR